VLALGETLLVFIAPTGLTFSLTLLLPGLVLIVPGLTPLCILGLLSVVDTVKLGLISPPSGLGEATLDVVTLSAGSTMIPDRLARMFATSCLSDGVSVLALPGDSDSFPCPISINSFSGLVEALLVPCLGICSCRPAG